MFRLYADAILSNTSESGTQDNHVHDLFHDNNKYGNSIVGSDALERLHQYSSGHIKEEDEHIVDMTLFEGCHAILQEAFRLFAAQQPKEANRHIASIDSLLQEFGTKDAKTFVAFHANRLRAFGYACNNMHVKSVKASNSAIAHCPTVNSTRARGLVDVLVLVSNCYSSLNKFEEAVHSARLGVDIAHDYLDKTVDEVFVNGNDNHDSDSVVNGMRVYLGPLLSDHLLLPFAYFNLATQLRRSGAVEESLSWYEKSVHTAERSGVQHQVLSALSSGLSEAEKFLRDTVPSPAKTVQARDTVVGDRISSGMEGLDGTPERDHRSGRRPLRAGAGERSRPKPSESEASISSSDPNDGYVENKPEEYRQYAPDSDYPVENMTNNSTIPTQTQDSGYGTESSGNGQGRGWKLNKRYDPSSTNDDISHITGDDENQYYFPTRPRPKSALSRLGNNYDTVSLTSAASTPNRTQQKRHSIGGGEFNNRNLTSAFGASPGKLLPKKFQQTLQQEQLYDNSEVNRMVVERSTEWNGHGDSLEIPDMPTMESLQAADLKDPLLKSMNEKLSKQCINAENYQEYISQQRAYLEEQLRGVRGWSRLKAIHEAKADRKKYLTSAVEMRFERRCAFDDRMDTFESIIKAQRLKAADDIQFVERGSEHFFEGMVVDIKRSSKPNSERDRCVIVRARVNGSFDAEIIETGELLINIHPHVIRIPTIPGVDDRRPAPQEFKAGQKVKCRAGKYGRWFTGFIEKVLQGGHYKIEFLDGTVEESVPQKRLKPVEKSVDNDPSSGFDISMVDQDYYVGEEVLMRFPHGCKWRVCTITKIRGDGEAYDVLLNGRQETERGISRSHLRKLGSMLFGYGSDYCPSRKVLDRCVAAQRKHQVGPESSVHQTPKTAINAPAEVPKSSCTRQLDEENAVAVSREDKSIGLKHFKAMCKSSTDSPVKAEKGMAAPLSSSLQVNINPANNERVVSTMRDRFIQDMHRNVSMLNTSATERKYARIIRQERLRLDSVVRLQAVFRGVLTRYRLRYESWCTSLRQQLVNDEEKLSVIRSDLLKWYQQSLSAVLVKSESPAGEPSEHKEPSTHQQLDDNEKGEEEKEVEVVATVTDPMEQMRQELLAMHEQQLKTQRLELKSMFASEMKDLLGAHQGKRDVIPSEENKAEFLHARTASSSSLVESVELRNAMNNEALPFGIDDTYIQDVTWMKDLYLDIWGGAQLPPVEALAIHASSKTLFGVLEAFLPLQLSSVDVSTISEFVLDHSILFAKDPENDSDITIKVRLDNSSGKSVKLKCPGDKVAGLCDSGQHVKITLDSATQFDISATSIRLDVLSRLLEGLWDAHVAWAAQRMLLRVALHRVLQGISALVASSPVTSEQDDPRDEREGSQKSLREAQKNVSKQPNSWISQRFLLFEELSSILRSGRDHRQRYLSSVEQLRGELANLVKRWRCTSDPVADLCDGLQDVAATIFCTFDDYLKTESSTNTHWHQDVKDNLLMSHHSDCLAPILKRTILKFLAVFRFGSLYEDMFFNALMTLCHDKFVSGFGFAETYDWSNLYAHTKTWINLLHGGDIDFSSEEFKHMYANFVDLVHKAENLITVSEQESSSLERNIINEIEIFTGQVLKRNI